MQERLQRFGGFLAGMVIPNIGAFIAWGLLTALVIPTGWFNELGIATPETWAPVSDALVGPIIVNLLPILVAYTCLLYTSPSPRDLSTSRMPSSA